MHKMRLFTIVLSVALLVGCFYCFVKIVNVTRNAQKQFGLTPVSVYQLLTDGAAMVKSSEGRVNILLLGVGGENHDGPDLTDTIIVLSFDMAKKTVTLLSIPRDIWSDTLRDKVNSAYHYGEEKGTGDGLVLSKSILEEITGISIQYAMVIDFSQFEKLIDYIGGIDIVVPKSFEDTHYPIAGRENDDCLGDITYACRYQTIAFQEGIQHMDGARALMYVRSRYAEGEEGTDFARGRRQQDVIVAMKAKILSLEPWYHPDLAVQLFHLFDQATKTDLTVSQMAALAKLGMGVQENGIRKISIEPYLVEAPTDLYNRYVLISNDPIGMRTFIQKSLTTQ